MRVTEKLIKQIISLIEGRTVPSSAIKGSWVDELLSEGILICVCSGSRRNYRIRDITAFLGALERHNEMLRDPYKALKLLISGSERSEMAAETGNSKARSVRSCPGFAVNSFQPVNAMLGGQEISILPVEGTFLFICDWKSFSIPDDAVIVGVENMENFRKVAQQKAFFMGCFKNHNSLHPEEKVTLADEGLPMMLFVSRYPKSNDLIEWLKTVPNPYFHFGDYDLEGIEIFQTEFVTHIQTPVNSQSAAPKRICRYLIPTDIEQRLMQGSRQRYDAQYLGTRNVHSDDPDLMRLISLINHYRRCYDQEGYIAKPLEQ